MVILCEDGNQRPVLGYFRDYTNIPIFLHEKTIV
jgi:hypothetical protein